MSTSCITTTDSPNTQTLPYHEYLQSKELSTISVSYPQDHHQKRQSQDAQNDQDISIEPNNDNSNSNKITTTIDYKSNAKMSIEEKMNQNWPEIIPSSLDRIQTATSTSIFDDFDAHFCVRYDEHSIQHYCLNSSNEEKISSKHRIGLNEKTNSSSLSEVRKVLANYFESNHKKKRSDSTKPKLHNTVANGFTILDTNTDQNSDFKSNQIQESESRLGSTWINQEEREISPIKKKKILQYDKELNNLRRYHHIKLDHPNENDELHRSNRWNLILNNQFNNQENREKMVVNSSRSVLTNKRTFSIDDNNNNATITQISQDDRIKTYIQDNIRILNKARDILEQRFPIVKKNYFKLEHNPQYLNEESKDINMKHNTLFDYIGDGSILSTARVTSTDTSIMDINNKKNGNYKYNNDNSIQMKKLEYHNNRVFKKVKAKYEIDDIEKNDNENEDNNKNKNKNRFDNILPDGNNNRVIPKIISHRRDHSGNQPPHHHIRNISLCLRDNTYDLKNYDIQNILVDHKATTIIQKSTIDKLIKLNEQINDKALIDKINKIIGRDNMNIINMHDKTLQLQKTSNINSQNKENIKPNIKTSFLPSIKGAIPSLSIKIDKQGYKEYANDNEVMKKSEYLMNLAGIYDEKNMIMNMNNEAKPTKIPLHKKVKIGINDFTINMRYYDIDKSQYHNEIPLKRYFFQLLLSQSLILIAYLLDYSNPVYLHYIQRQYKN